MAAVEELYVLFYLSTSTSIGIISKAPVGHYTDKDLVTESASICYVTCVGKRTKWKGGI